VSPPDRDRAWLQPWEGSTRRVDRDATEVRLVLAVGAWIEGTLLRADGTPGGGITVGAVTPAGRWITNSTDAQGRFRLAVPATGTVDLLWNGQRVVTGARGAAEIVDSREFAEVLGASPGMRGIVLRARAVADDASQRVRVVGPDGSPVAGIGVWARDLSLNDPKMPRAQTDAEGRATLTGMPDRRHRFGTGETTGLAPSRWFETTPGREPEIVLTLRATREIRGTMIDADGRPFTEYESGGKRRAASPWARSESASGQSWYQSRGAAADGSFTILVPDDDPGPFVVEFHLPPEGEGAAFVQRGASAAGVVPGGPDVRLVIAPRTLDD
jgi:hypothetical protein